jgi:hypothetical protein
MKVHKLLLVCGHVHSGAGMNGAVCVGMFIQAQGWIQPCACAFSFEQRDGLVLAQEHADNGGSDQ